MRLFQFLLLVTAGRTIDALPRRILYDSNSAPSTTSDKPDRWKDLATGAVAGVVASAALGFPAMYKWGVRRGSQRSPSPGSTDASSPPESPGARSPPDNTDALLRPQRQASTNEYTPLNSRESYLFDEDLRIRRERQHLKPPPRIPSSSSVAETLDRFDRNMRTGSDFLEYNWWNTWRFHCIQALQKRLPEVLHIKRSAWCDIKYEELLSEHLDRFPELLEDRDTPSAELISQQIVDLERQYPQRASDPPPVRENMAETQAVVNSLSRRRRIRIIEAFGKRNPPARPETSEPVDAIVDLYERGQFQDFDFPYSQYIWWKDWIHVCRYLVIEQAEGATEQEGNDWCKMQFLEQWKEHPDRLPGPLRQVPNVEDIRADLDRRRDDNIRQRPSEFSMTQQIKPALHPMRAVAAAEKHFPKLVNNVGSAFSSLGPSISSSMKQLGSSTTFSTEAFGSLGRLP